MLSSTNEPTIFRWGVSTSAYQIEGARFEDGKGESIWDRFADDGHMGPGGDIACDHYHRLDEDLDLLAEMGVNAYHFSVAWTRVIPDGNGRTNAKGLDFYSRLVDGLLDRGIEPWLTLYHWDLPQALQDRGGWASRDTAGAFATYAGVVSEWLGDRVKHWITHNEPWVATYLGHLYGSFAPGIQDWATAIEVGHNILLSHGWAVEAIRDTVDSAAVGISLDCRPTWPATESEEDHAAAEHFDGFRNRWFFDPIFGHGYPEDILRAFHVEGRIDGLEPAFVRSGDLDRIATPIDFLGLNYYTTMATEAGSEEVDEPERVPGADQPEGFTEMGWAIDPRGLRDYLKLINTRYQPRSIVVTENGASFSDGPGDDGAVVDRRRIDYLESHVDAVVAAAESGVPIDGYFVWSFLDNLEWTQGFEQRFGLVWVDHQTQERRPKESFYWYRELVAGESRTSQALEAARIFQP
jgi:beta-glucosidase